jgi:antitoxin MazE
MYILIHIIYERKSMNLTQNLQKWGNSAGVRLPKKVIEEAHLKLDEPLEITIKGKSVILTPLTKSKKITLKDMLKGVTPDDVGGEQDWGVPVGKEIW